MANPTDGAHGRAVAINDGLGLDGWQLVTSNFVRAEAHGLILRRTSRFEGLKFVETLHESGIAMVSIDGRLESTAVEIIRHYQDKDFSLTDATSFALMERLGIRTAFTFDADFERYGFTALA